MSIRSHARHGRSDKIDMTDMARSTLAFATLLLGLAGSLAVLPIGVWIIAARGFH